MMRAFLQKAAMVKPVCFLAGTLVETKAGRRAIERLRVGDLVLSRDERTGQQGYKRVTQLNRGKAVQVCKVVTRPHVRGRTERHRVGEASAGGEGSDEPPSATQEILSTRNHPYYSVSRRRWIDADRLRAGELLRASDGSLLEVVKVEWWAEEAPTYNFEVEDWHSYFVSEAPGDPGVWVHNGPGDLAPAGDHVLGEFFNLEGPPRGGRGMFFARGHLDSSLNARGVRVLRLHFFLREGVEMTTQRGGDLFEQALRHFGGADSLDGIIATWNTEYPDNLKSLNRAVSEGMDELTAARTRTFTGVMAERYKFGTVSRVGTAHGPEGARTFIEFAFSRGCGPR